MGYRAYVKNIVNTNWVVYLNNSKSFTVDQVRYYSSKTAESTFNSYSNQFATHSSKQIEYFTFS
jgi:hypothetical protein